MILFHISAIPIEISMIRYDTTGFQDKNTKDITICKQSNLPKFKPSWIMMCGIHPRYWMYRKIYILQLSLATSSANVQRCWRDNYQMKKGQEMASQSTVVDSRNKRSVHNNDYYSSKKCLHVTALRKLS